MSSGTTHAATRKLVTTAEMRALEQAAVDAGGTWAGLMEQAGWGVSQVALRLFGAPAGKRVLVLVGPGNNGGDGLVVARHLHDAGAEVSLYLWRREHSGDLNWQRCRERDIPAYNAADDRDRAELRRLLRACDLVVDALLGAGISRAVTGELAEIVETVNTFDQRPMTNDQSQHGSCGSSLVFRPSSLVILAVDLPTGIHSDTGALMGVALRADLTVATGLVKRGLLYYPGRSYAGAIDVVEIGLPPAHLEAIMSEGIDAARARELLPRRPDDAHKGTFGKVMVVAGSLQYPGAAGLATAAAARVGAGLVTLAVGRSGLGGPGRLPEITLQLLPEADWNALGEGAADEALKHLGSYQALLVGPGIGREEPTRAFLERLLGLDSPRHRGHIGFRIGASAEKPAEKQRPELPPTVIDADGLTLLSQIEQWWERLPRGRCVLTPHPGEMKRLLAVEELDADRVKVAEGAAAQWGQVVVLKGATTVVAEPEGRSMVNNGGNAALATAGTGDVLAGAIAGLLAQGLASFDAATLGVYLHSAAGRLLRDDLGDMGTIASDLLPRLPKAIRELKG
ncbi:MAG TPA: NAD(P)H-hydrate dehydratase [Roseiflexaceae bacterium]|nr:NAD(P)H-hydrate dehydratase [Roseiflexaceae bacterium]